jgi:zinc D-Ala-D-Ala dipeptidase
MKPYQQVPIVECGEPLIPIPLDQFAIVTPHPYVKIGAPYGEKSPFYLRQGVLKSLLDAQHYLQQTQPGWQIQIFDAYRPIAVQQFMVEYTFAEIVRSQGLVAETLTTDQRQAILEQVYEFWAVPSPDPATPPPHSTGAAIDVTLVDATGQVVDMGADIDEISPRSYPNHFVDSAIATEQTFHHHRQLLSQAMRSADFQPHPNEWWHFSQGDQLWAWLTNQTNPDQSVVARYGRVL